jgi:hypothetical protein
MLESQGRLEGDYFAWSYRMRDPRVELLFRIAITAFGSRNFKSDGVANLNMGIRVDNEVMRRFYPDAWDHAWHARVLDFSYRVGRDSVASLRAAFHFIREVDVHDGEAVKVFTRDLARRVAQADLDFVIQCRALRSEMEARIRRVRADWGATSLSNGMPPWAAESARLAGSVGLELSTEILPEPALHLSDAGAVR